MTSSPPPDEPRFYARSATPESPRPIHIPEPSTIPVLENQIDPLFNLMTTHLPAPHASRNMTAMDHEMAQLAAAEQASQSVPTGSSGESIDAQVLNGTHNAVNSNGEIQANIKAEEVPQTGLDKSSSTIVDQHTSSLTEQLSASLATFDESSSSRSGLQPNILNPSPAPDSTQSPDAPPPENPQASMISERTTATDKPVEISGGSEEEDKSEEAANAGVNYQALLDNIISSNAAPQMRTAEAAGNENSDADVPTPSSAIPPQASLASSAGLPPRPPPQERPAIHPNYAPTDDIRSFHYPHITPSSAQSSQPAQSPTVSNSFRPSQFPSNLSSPAIAGTGSNGLPPPPMASFQQPSTPQESKDEPGRAVQQPARLSDANATSPGKPVPGSREDEAPWPAEIQRKYNQFLRDEEVYTSEGTWDKFPQGSRLFVGNLPTEVVTKRDIFHIFHRFGRLAQISIKQAYGFVQFMETKDCMAAMASEQNGKIKDRNMHLEISKPPKNSRGSGGGGGNQRGSHYRRSRSPERGGRGAQRGGDRYNRDNRDVPFSDFRDEPRRRDDYRPGRSPSPRGFRGRDDYRGGRDRSPDRYYGGRRDRSRSPYGRGSGRYRSPSPQRRRSMDEDDALPMRRRDPRDVPDIQIILVDELDAPFVQYVEKSFRDRGLRVAVLRLMPNLPLDAIVRRQIYEGVLAVVQLHRAARVMGKIPLKVFDRSNDINNVRFEEYENLEAPVAAEVAARSKQKQTAMLAGQQQPPPAQQYPNVLPSFGAAPAYGQPGPQMTPQQPTPQAAAVAAAAGQPNLANLITSLDGPALQKLLSAMQHSPQGQAQSGPGPHAGPGPSPVSAQPSPTGAPDLAALLGSVTKQTQQQRPGPPQQPGFPYAGTPQQQPQIPTLQQPYGFGAPPPYAQQQQQQPTPQPGQPPMGYPAQQPQQPQQGTGQQPSPQQVQNIMAQLARWKQ